MKTIEKKFQFSKVIVIFAMLISIVGVVSSLVLSLDSSVAMTLIGTCGGYLTIIITFYLRKSQSENTVKISLSAYERMLKLKQKYSTVEECDEMMEELEDNIKGRVNQTIGKDMDDATRVIDDI